ncbi:Pyruvate kinase family protein isoform 1 [Hibiscus syriacus]|uniref:Pyruvate kinase family protein isoform 1 n=1 Tax=Hibiscus syriacus TaxID=106335 RepID=A0A6A2WRS7_HIBSY|nr:uncharacterized protein LOC120184445 [Hibiscus syriacus]KAE8663763.1 Pyruvate kinase family protein isoform 1 [Hibiscus syriacus]
MYSVQMISPVLCSIPTFNLRRKKILNFNTCRRRRNFHGQGSRICCATQEGEESPESLFMKELKRRGMTPASLLEDGKKANYEMKIGEETTSFSTTNAVSTDYEKSLSNQRQRSMDLNSEGLEGLVPRAKLLLTLGGTFFLGFWPLILSTIIFFSALYLYFGLSFIHDGSKTPVSPPPYIDPYALLEDERISGTASPSN